MSEQQTSTLLSTLQEAVRALHVVHNGNNGFTTLLLRLTSDPTDDVDPVNYDKSKDYSTALAITSLVSIIQEIESQQKAQDSAFMEAASHIVTQLSNVNDFLSGVGKHLATTADTLSASGYPIRRDDFEYDAADPDKRPQLINVLAALKTDARNLELLAMRVSRGLRGMSDCEMPPTEDAAFLP